MGLIHPADGENPAEPFVGLAHLLSVPLIEGAFVLVDQNALFGKGP